MTKATTKQAMPYINKSSPKRPWQAERKPFSGIKVKNKKFYNSAAWIRLRDAFRNANPMCKNTEVCHGVTEYVDHIVPINDNGAMLEWSNLQPLCSSCNASKTGKQSYKKVIEQG